METVEARTVKIDEDQAWKLLRKAKEIIVGRGKKYSVFHPASTNKPEILDQCLGRTGNLRAPALKVGDRYVIGFTEEMYDAYIT